MPSSPEAISTLIAGVWAGLTLAFALGAAAGATAYSDGPPLAHTGGFGEPTCHRCHFDHPLNADSESLRLDGLPGSYAPGARYTLTIRLADEALRRAGFQMAARFVDGPAAGSQAGELLAPDTNVRVRTAASGVQYAHHSQAGSQPSTPGVASWSVVWRAPQGGENAPVAIHLVANAANGDDSEFGDRVHAVRRMVGPSR